MDYVEFWTVRCLWGSNQVYEMTNGNFLFAGLRIVNFDQWLLLTKGTGF